MKKIVRWGVLSSLLIEMVVVCFYTDTTMSFSNKKPEINEKTLKKFLPNLKGVRFVTPKDLLINDVLFEGAEDIARYGCSLRIEQDLNRDGQTDVAICGAYFNSALKKEIPFLVILTLQYDGSLKKVFFREFDHFFFICKESEFTQFQENEVLRLGFKAHTDVTGRIFYEDKNYTFRESPSP